MKNTDQNRQNRKSGVALVIVLGLLAVLTTLAVAFAIAMRVEHMAAQNYADAVRAENLVHAGFASAMEWIDGSMTVPAPLTYPRWTSGTQLVEAVASTGNSGPCGDLLTGEATNAIPG